MNLAHHQPLKPVDNRKQLKTVEKHQQQCDVCLCSGETHFRVTSDKRKGWLFICPSCWPILAEEVGYRFGGTRKANRRKRQQSNHR
jgi:hypothetical protein